VVLRREQVAELDLITSLGFQAGYLEGAIVAQGGARAIDHIESQMSPDNEAALGRLIRAAALQEVQVVLVVEPFPCPVDTNDCVAGFLRSAFYRDLQALADDQEVPLLNALQEPWPESLFVDDRHLNTHGVDRFQRLVANSIADLGSG
jgi:hypothetical protein